MKWRKLGSWRIGVSAASIELAAACLSAQRLVMAGWLWRIAGAGWQHQLAGQ
jgi:hypothetical protein